MTGAVGTIIGFKWPGGHRTEGQQPCGMHTMFDDCKVGRMTQSIFRSEPVQSLRLSRARMAGLNLSITSSLLSVLAWAVTIHKVQGLSLDKAAIDLGQSVFAHAQAYVALGKVKSLEGVKWQG